MNRYVKISAALAAFALLLVVMGLSTQNVVQAAPGDISFTPDPYVCSLMECVGDDGGNRNQIRIDVADATAGTVEITNLDVATVDDDVNENNDNPKSVTLDGQGMATITVVQSGSADGDLAESEIRGFNGNRIRIKYEPTDGSTFATFGTFTVDNVSPTLVPIAPSAPLVTKSNVDITFSADFTDTGSGFDSDAKKIMYSAAGTLAATDGNSATIDGSVRLVVAGNVVEIDDGDLTAIDDGWRVIKTINSSAILGIGANTIWFFEVKDRAGNSERTSDGVSGKATDGSTTTVVDSRFISYLHTQAFSGSEIEISDADGNVVDSAPISSLYRLQRNFHGRQNPLSVTVGENEVNGYGGYHLLLQG